MQCSRLIRAFRSDHVMNGISTQESEVRRISSDLKSAKPLKPITSLLKPPAPSFIKYHSYILASRWQLSNTRSSNTFYKGSSHTQFYFLLFSSFFILHRNDPDLKASPSRDVSATSPDCGDTSSVETIGQLISWSTDNKKYRLLLFKPKMTKLSWFQVLE